MASGLPGLAIAAILVFLLITGTMMMSNPESGMVINDEKVTLYSGKWRASYPRDQIDHFRYIDWADGGGFEIHTKDRKHLSIPNKCYGKPAALLAYLEQQNIKVVWQGYEEAGDDS